MCGRFSLTYSPEDLKEFFGLAGVPDYGPRYNIAPSQQVPAIRLEEGKRRLAMLRWGLIPFWADDAKIGHKMINARAETVHKLPAFRAAIRKRRCVIPGGGGFFEWSEKGKEKQPFYIYRRDGKPIAFAGLWERWHNEVKDQVIESCTIITTVANELVDRLHDRMPVILETNNVALWLGTEEQSPEKLLPLLKPAEEEVLEMYQVSSYVNKPQNEGEKCIEPEGERIKC